jgi:hypothetical protein
VNPRDIFWFVSLEQSLKKAGNAPHGRSVFSFAGCEGPRDQSVKRPINQGISIDKEQARRFWKLHHSI